MKTGGIQIVAQHSIPNWVRFAKDDESALAPIEPISFRARRVNGAHRISADGWRLMALSHPRLVRLQFECGDVGGRRQGPCPRRGLSRAPGTTEPDDG